MFDLNRGERLGCINWYGEFHHDDKDGGVWWFAVRPDVKNFEGAVRGAVADFLAANPNTSGHPFNWGDAIDNVPDEFWRGHGLRSLDNPLPDFQFTVNHDEQLDEE
jgi:hypothetical protein